MNARDFQREYGSQPTLRIRKAPKKRGAVTTGNATMNATEAAYALTLQARQEAGEIAWWGFGVVRLRLAEGAYYKPDFVILLAPGHAPEGDGRLLEIHEVKGHKREAAMVRYRVAREQHPWARFCMVFRDGAGWRVEE